VLFFFAYRIAIILFLYLYMYFYRLAVNKSCSLVCILNVALQNCGTDDKALPIRRLGWATGAVQSTCVAGNDPWGTH